ncbi:smp-30/gluconolaconase/lre-like region containing protein [Niveomyces insectorum RCEF 264]|uniref:Smp-30/gluconolaconase/lre-like region containing protein n=1 Tax=Niveomyces insectorum RCEF 264 TaxID=1081102 RepID=A0A167PVE7_9HYPO|nr:smp-30/gluconolaconase/lre-like region containing protein [Niveomyces insectorum RCEF 264]
MSVSRNSAIKISKTPLQVVNRRQGSRRESPILLEGRPSVVGVSLVQYHPDFANIVGKDARHALLISSAESSRNAFFHSGCAYVLEPEASPDQPGGGSANGNRSGNGNVDGREEVLYTTSNLLQTTSSSQLPVVLISRIALRRSPTGEVTAVDWAKLRPPTTMPMPAGAISYGGSGLASASTNPITASTSGGVLYCAQGNPSPGTSGLFYMPRGKPPLPLVTSYYGREFNSVHDVARAPDGSLWFTDPCHGFEQDFRKKPQLPCHIYRFDPVTGDLRVVADGLQRPTGICFGHDAMTVYVTDTDALHGDGNQDATRAATIYAFDVVRRGGADFLANKRVFAYALRGVPMGIRCDAAGNVYAGCADGVEVWNLGGMLLGVIEVTGGVTSFCFSREGEMFLCSEQTLWWVHFKPKVDVARWGASVVPMTVDPDDNFI